ncbi:hypothetical protein OB919_20095 [Halobacteria archaeon AArc-curdl1]|uniref:Uncharacterized protein n=1 Tax=Natronosalvus hydrolyticus TaxID=2979988 RepID=A0AAP2ZC62_9EURY|nr:hypothetical protein [Halobacteria archaeon AArc-curdl1]
MSEVECEYCGELFKEQGLGTHQRFCGGAEEEDGQDDPTHTDLEETVLERDNRACRRCNVQDDLVVHRIDSAQSDNLRYLATLCVRCDGEIEGLHPRTKRTKIGEIR